MTIASSTVKIKYSTQTSAPQTLLKGELAYSSLSGNLYLGNEQGIPFIIAGAALIDRVGGLERLVDGLQNQLDQQVSTLTQSIDDEIARARLVETSIQNTISQLQAALIAEQNRAEAAETQLSARITSIESLLSGSSNGTTTVTDLVVRGNLVVQGETTSISSTVTTIEDPTITLGAGTHSADGCDRGIEFKYFDTSTQTVKTGFMGMDQATKEFKFLREDGVLGDINVNAITVTSKIVGNGTTVLSGFIIDCGTF